jgi:hypothetical protein
MYRPVTYGMVEDEEESTMRPYPANQHSAPWQIADGMAVYATDGEKVGTIRNFDPQADYFDVQKGRLFHKDFYVAMDDVSMVNASGIVLRRAKEDLEDDRYAAPPKASGTADKENARETECTIAHETVSVAEHKVVTEVKTHDGDFYE